MIRVEGYEEETIEEDVLDRPDAPVADQNDNTRAEGYHEEGDGQHGGGRVVSDGVIERLGSTEV